MSNSAEQRRIARMLADLAKEAQPSITRAGRDIKIVYRGQEFRIRAEVSAVTNEQIARLR